jgi:endonuclease/exonuclease/phosphatase family metal-dependent hydrolase
MTTGVRSYSITSQAHRFSPYGLTQGRTYYFRVRAYNGTVPSATAPEVLRAVAPARGQNVRVMTYNVLHQPAAGTKEGGTTVGTWAQRRVPMIALIRKVNPDVLGLQEASDWVGAVKGPRVADDLAARLGGYTVAHTEVTPGQKGWMRTARYILYRTATYKAVGSGGHWELGPGRFAAYQQLQNRTTGARFLAVSVHLSPGGGSAADLSRRAETQKLLSSARSLQASTHVPVIYVGDFNSHEGHPLDGPGVAMRAAGVADADEVAQVKANRRYNSANQYLRSPMLGHWDIDHVYAPAGVAVRGWEIALTLTRGRFVGTIPSDHNPVVADVVLPY